MGGNIDEDGGRGLAGKRRALDGGPHCDDEVGVDFMARLDAELGLKELMDGGGAGGPADEHDLVELTGGDAGVGDGFLEAIERFVEPWIDEFLVSGAFDLCF